MKNEIYMGSLVSPWKSDCKIKYITFNVTDDCNLACTYCYFTHKTSKNKMSINVARRAIDAILISDCVNEYDGVVWDFIGGEPTLEMDLIDEICDYILLKMYEMKHKWLLCYRIMIGTNGLLYSSKKVQDFYKKHNLNVHIGITIDGNKAKHDLSRKRKDGSGSYDEVLENVLLWQKQTNLHMTKATFSHADLPMLKDSIISLWNIGIKNVMANIVFEDVWNPGDEDIYYEQLISLADYVIENKLWDRYSVRFFDPMVGLPMADNMLYSNYCGSGEMLTVSTEGKFYPCVRFLDSSMTDKKGLPIGDTNNGINENFVRSFKSMTIKAINNGKCKDCNISNGCGWCVGYNFDCSEVNSILERQKTNCTMHKINTLASRYFWYEFYKSTGINSPRQEYLFNLESSSKNYLFIMVNEEDFFICANSVSLPDNSVMTEEIFNIALDYCVKNDFIPIILGSKNHFNSHKSIYYGKTYSEQMKEIKNFFLCLHDYEIEYFNFDIPYINVILDISPENVFNIITILSDLLQRCESISNIHLQINENYNWNAERIKGYERALKKIVDDCLIPLWHSGRFVDIDIITYELHSDKRQYCEAGVHSYTVSSNGDIYPCPAFVNKSDNIDYRIGNIYDGIDNHLSYHCDPNNSSLCQTCKNVKCKFCVSKNKEITNELLIASEFHCAKSSAERKVSKYFLGMLNVNKIECPFELNKNIIVNEYYDPLSKLRGITQLDKDLEGV